MNLHELRTPQPLRDADFAAIRARVKAEIAHREERPWLAMLLRFAFAASLLVLVVPHVKDRVPDVPVVVQARRAEPPPIPPSAPPSAPSLAPSLAPSSERRLPAGRAAAFQAARLAGRDASGPAGRMPALRAEYASRIEIITADPTIRIIWITPKENS